MFNLCSLCQEPVLMDSCTFWFPAILANEYCCYCCCMIASVGVFSSVGWRGTARTVVRTSTMRLDLDAGVAANYFRSPTRLIRVVVAPTRAAASSSWPSTLEMVLGSSDSPSWVVAIRLRDPWESTSGGSFQDVWPLTTADYRKVWAPLRTNHRSLFFSPRKDLHIT